MALIVYDMQAGILSQIGDGKLITDKVHEALSAARSRDARDFYASSLSPQGDYGGGAIPDGHGLAARAVA